MATEVRCVCALGAQLGEGPIWCARQRALWFVDIKGRRIHRYDERAGGLQSWVTAEDVGFIAPKTGGGFICGLKSGLHTFEPATAAFELITRVDSDLPRNRLNDACVDSLGRPWFGTMDDDEAQPTGALYRFDARGLSRCDTGYVISNGPAVSPKADILYHVDTTQRVIYAFDLDRDGSLTNRRPFVRIGETGGYPDGITMDSEGCVWAALFGVGRLQRYSPSGELLQMLSLPVAHCTKAAFGGEDLRTLYITTASKGLSAQEQREQPLAGALFAANTDTPGLPQYSARYAY